MHKNPETEEEDPERMEEILRKLKDEFSCLPPVLIQRIIRRDDVNGDIDKARKELQEFHDMKQSLDISKSPVAAKSPTGKPKGIFNDFQVNSYDNQAHRDQNASQSGGVRESPKEVPRGCPRSGFVQRQGDYQEFRDNDTGIPVPLMPKEWGFGDDNPFKPQLKPKPRNRGQGYKRGGSNFQKAGEFQTPEGFHAGDQFSFGDGQFQYTQRQCYAKGEKGQQNEGRRKARGTQGSNSASGIFATGRACDDSDLGSFGGVASDRHGQDHGMRRAKSLYSVAGCDQSAGTGENTKGQSLFEWNKLHAYGQTEFTTDDVAVSGKEKQPRNSDALVMVNDITKNDDEDEKEEDEEKHEDLVDVEFTVDDAGEEKEDNVLSTELSSPSSKNAEGELEDPERTEEILRRLKEEFSCLPPVLFKRVLCREDVNGDIDKARKKLQEDMKQPLDISKSPVAAKSPTGKSKGILDDSQVNSYGKQGHRDQNASQSGGVRGRPKEVPRGGPRSGFIQRQDDYQELKDNDTGMPIPSTSEEWGFGDDDTFQPQTGHGSRVGRGSQPKPKPKNRGQGVSRKGGSNFQKPGEYQPPGGFHEGEQFSFGDEQEVLKLRKSNAPLMVNDITGKDSDVPDESGGLGASVSDADKALVGQQSETKTQQLHIAVDPDVMEFVTTTAFRDQLNKSLALKKSKITWKPNKKVAVIVFSGDDNSDSWQSECIDEVQKYLGKFAKCDVQVNKDLWEAVVTQLSSVCTCLGEDPPLVKTVDDSFVVRIVSLSTDMKDYEEKLKAKLEEIYQEETGKTYMTKTVSNVPEHRLILLKKMQFVKKLQEKKEELEIELDVKGKEIHFKGPQLQITEAIMNIEKQMSNMVEKKLTLSDGILKVLRFDKGQRKVKRELKNNDMRAVFVIGSKDARIIGTSAEHADQAARHVNKLMLEKKVKVDEKSKHLLKTPEWYQACEMINKETDVHVHHNEWNDTYVAGFRDDVTEVMNILNKILEANRIREEQFRCPSQIVRTYIAEHRQEDLRTMENELKDFEVTIRDGKGDDDFDISGNQEGLTHVRQKLDAVIEDIDSQTFFMKQPGLRTYFDSGEGDRLVKSVEKDQGCLIQVQKYFGQRRVDLCTQGATENFVSSGNEESAYSGNDADDEDYGFNGNRGDEGAASVADGSVLIMTQGQRISWRTGNIETEKADVIVLSHGACSQAIINAGGPGLVPPDAGEITVSGGFGLPCSHVIRTTCCKWNGGKGEGTLRAIIQKCLQKGEELGARSIAFPGIGTGNVHFPRHAASRIMLEEATSFCQANPGSNVQDIRFVLFRQDHTLTAAFKQQMKKLQAKHKSRLEGTIGRLGSKLKQRAAASTERVNIEVLQGDLCQETTDAIVNITSKDMNMEKAGALSKAVARASGPQVQAECSRLGQQSGGTAVITSGGNLPARFIIHLIPDSAQKDHLQQCVERCLRLAETHGLQFISIPAVGTGAFGLSAVDSASLIFKALRNFSGSFNTVRTVRIVVFQLPMLQAFQQQHRRYSSLSHFNDAMTLPTCMDLRFSVEVINGDLTQENTDAIMNINSTDMNMNNAGELSKALANACGQQVQQECSQLGKQQPGSAVMTSGGKLNVPHIIHIVPGSSDKMDLQKCLEEGLRLADKNKLQSISIPAIGTGRFGLPATDSANLVFKALRNFIGNFQNITKVRIVVFQGGLIQAFQQEKTRLDTQYVSRGSSIPAPATDQSFQPSVRVLVTGKNKDSVDRAVKELKTTLTKACITKKISDEDIASLSPTQINNLQREAYKCDTEVKFDHTAKCVTVCGYHGNVHDMISKIKDEISKGIKEKSQKQEDDDAGLISKMVEWSYESSGRKIALDLKTNAKLERAYQTETVSIVQVTLRGKEFVVDMKTLKGRCQRDGEQINIYRKAKEGIPLPGNWSPMPLGTKVLSVTLVPGSPEYQDVKVKFHATGGVNILNIERIQNPLLYQSYMVRKRIMDEDTGGDNEKRLFHGTDTKNINHINTQGFNRSFCGSAHGKLFGSGVYFAKKASYSAHYTGSERGVCCMYLARVLVGRYCQGTPELITPPSRDPARPELLFDSVVNDPTDPTIFVVFADYQCYPEYLISFEKMC